MDPVLETHNLDSSKAPLTSPPSAESGRGRRSSLRTRYETEAKDILSRTGGIESVRQRLGLSQRAMAQALLVDPSAWTRWVKGITPTPPYVARMLELFLLSLERHPELNVESLLHNRQIQAQTLRQILQTQDKLRGLEQQQKDLLQANSVTVAGSEDLQHLIEEIRKQNQERSRRLAIVLGILATVNILTIIFFALL